MKYLMIIKIIVLFLLLGCDSKSSSKRDRNNTQKRILAEPTTFITIDINGQQFITFDPVVMKHPLYYIKGIKCEPSSILEGYRILYADGIAVASIAEFTFSLAPENKTVFITTVMPVACTQETLFKDGFESP
jgi:hypothetical protein